MGMHDLKPTKNQTMLKEKESSIKVRGVENFYLEIPALMIKIW